MNRFAHTLSMLVGLTLCAMIPHTQPAAHAATVRTVALSGQQAPGTPGGVSFSGLSISIGAAANFGPVINDAGQVAFPGNLTGDGVDTTNEVGIWSEGSGALSLIARKGNQVPGAPEGVVYSSFGFSHAPYLLLNDAGQTAFAGRLTGSASGWGFWSEGSGTLQLVARSGDPAPGAGPGATFASRSIFFRSPQLNNAGQTAFSAIWTNASVAGVGIWSDRSGSLTAIVLDGDAAPGLAGVSLYVRLGGTAMNDAGHIAFGGSLTGPGINGSNNQGVWSEASGSVALVARGGDQAPGMADGSHFYSFGDPATNNTGSVAFVARVVGVGVGRDTIYSNTSGSLKLIAGIDQSCCTSVWWPVLNNAGHTLFRAGEGDLWLERDGNLERVLDAYYLGNSASSAMPFLNDADQIAYRSGSSLYASDRTGTFQRIAGSGDLLEVAPGDFRTISSVGLGSYYPISEPRPNNSTAFNNRGQLVFWATFTDGTSGIFVSNRVAIPEPSTLALGAMTLLGFFASRRATRRPTAVAFRH